MIRTNSLGGVHHYFKSRLNDWLLAVNESGRRCVEMGIYGKDAPEFSPGISDSWRELFFGLDSFYFVTLATHTIGVPVSLSGGL
jgi:hypothetical protein